ncbi:MAG: ThiF family adenylyltransferase, partial [Acidobacteriaceae bacterium]|nr:ThiF family adenylyltransferase [Acidobacteriaceae bacterium]
VEPSNLQRQALFDEADARESLPKAVAAARKIGAFNSEVQVDARVDDLTPANVEALLGGVDLVLDATDNFETRYLINDYTVKNVVPWIYAAAVGSYGVTMNILAAETACLSCVFPSAPQGLVETCDTSGILNSVVNTVASIQTTEALKLLVGARDKLRRTLLSFDAWNNDRSEISTAFPRVDCETCAARNFPYLAGERRAHITLCGRNSVQIHERHRPVDFAEVSARLKAHGQVRYNDFVLNFQPNGYEITLFPDGRAIIKGTTDTGVARSLYARYIGS